jgi:hypothetical protein
MMKKLISRIKDGWMYFARTLGRVNTIILLTLVYLLIIGPMALLAKIFRKDLLQKKKQSMETTYWRDRATNAPTIERHKFQF